MVRKCTIPMRTNESRTNVDLFSISHYGLDSFCCTWNNHHLFVVCLFQPLRFSFFHLHLRYFYYFQSTTYFSVFFFFLCVIFVVCCCTRTPWPNVLFRAVRKNVRFFFHLFVCVCVSVSVNFCWAGTTTESVCPSWGRCFYSIFCSVPPGALGRVLLKGAASSNHDICIVAMNF